MIYFYLNVRVKKINSITKETNITYDTKYYTLKREVHIIIFLNKD